MVNLIKHLRNIRKQKLLFREKAASVGSPFEEKPLSLMDDIVFKIMFTSDTEDSREALRCLLSACTRREVTGVKIQNNELLPAHLEAKSPRLDVNVTFNDGEAADLEMQMGLSEDNLKDRAAQYIALLQAGQSKRGKKYRLSKRAYQIFFLNSDLFPGSNLLPRRYSYREEKEHDKLTEMTEIIFYELPKLEQRFKDYFEGKVGTETLSNEEKWCMFFKYRHEHQAKPLIKELCEKEDGIMRAEKQVTRISRDCRRYAREISEAKDRIDLAYKLKGAYDEAWEKCSAEKDKQFLELLDQGLSVEEIKQHLKKS